MHLSYENGLKKYGNGGDEALKAKLILKKKKLN
jgi:hypothetical protein